MNHGGNSTMRHCSMKMTFNTDYDNLCIVFKSWHIGNLSQFLLSLLAIAILGYLFERLRSFTSLKETEFQRGYAGQQSEGLLTHHSKSLKSGRPFRLCALYAVQLVFSYFLMLVAMTYNAYVILAIAIGAAFGYRRSHCDTVQTVGLCH
ncbi:Copper transport protein ctr6 [Schizosaccharomyces pombe]|uniref:Copper transport protein ctr6 n=1 Tax=Schizosaccharomyces pombe (strain 972 / ATCC 24843) TaxID=284812 RepID=CTR6_SCHPO|nr:Cu transporter Ctr6 [Schizosaccharomyces pombe]Q9USV7.1 RecName: Full=Copper transport protein ctr6; Short=Copper transporter 6 [Schizosaccharomyces pombe 972h-]CAB58134.1 vacuolar copper transporter Ctr6 [Schizosaccharomyces pombe]|eukprot:NP_595861.1 Cu transporter Ctr6 [Schizosaccharomyces pombe]